MTNCSYKKLRNWWNDFEVLSTALSRLHLRPTLDVATDLWFFLKNVLVFHQKIKNSIIMSSNSPPSGSLPRRSECRELNTWSHTRVHSSIPAANSGSKCPSMDAVVQLLSRVWLFATPWTEAPQASLSFTICWSLLNFMSIDLMMPSNHLVLCCPLLLLPSVFPSIRVFTNG